MEALVLLARVAETWSDGWLLVPGALSGGGRGSGCSGVVTVGCEHLEELGVLGKEDGVLLIQFAEQLTLYCCERSRMVCGSFECTFEAGGVVGKVLLRWCQQACVG